MGEQYSTEAAAGPRQNEGSGTGIPGDLQKKKIKLPIALRRYSSHCWKLYYIHNSKAATPRQLGVSNNTGQRDRGLKVRKCCYMLMLCLYRIMDEIVIASAICRWWLCSNQPHRGYLALLNRYPHNGLILILSSGHGIADVNSRSYSRFGCGEDPRALPSLNPVPYL